MTRAALLITLALAGCSNPGPEVCEPLNGTYLTTYTEISGDCGDIPASLSVRRPGDDLMPNDPDCSTESATSDDGCVLDFRHACWDRVIGHDRTEQMGTIAWEGGVATGIFEVEIHRTDTETIKCRSIYETVTEKQ